MQPNDFFPIPASVVFAENLGLAAKAIPLAGEAERWFGETGTDDVERLTSTVVTGEDISPYAAHTLSGATVFPRCLFLVNETESATLIRAANTSTVNPRRGSHDKLPWKTLDLTEITGQTVEKSHVFDVHLGETLVPYAMLQPLKAILPLKRGDNELPINKRSPGRIRLGGLERRMRGRWQTISNLWEENKARANKLTLLEQLNYYGKLSSQLTWQSDKGTRPVRLIYNQSGTPTAALLEDDNPLVDYTLYWITCKSTGEAHYLLAIINSDTLEGAVNPLMAKGQFGARHLQKHLWRLPIPEYDADNALHTEISDAGKAAVAGAERELARVRAEREESGKVFSVTVARRELRKWLRSSEEGKRVEVAVGELLNG